MNPLLLFVLLSFFAFCCAVVGYVTVTHFARWTQVSYRRRHATSLDVETARQQVASLDLPPVFLAVWDSPAEVLLGWSKADWFLEYWFEISEREPRLARCLPLFEKRDCYCTVVAFDPQTGEYLKYSLDEESELIVVAENYQQFAAYLMVAWVWAGDNDDDLEETARLLEFRHLDRLRAWAAIERDGSSDCDIDQRQFMKSTPPGR